MAAAVSVAVPLSSFKPSSLSARTSFIPPESINFNKAPLYKRNVSSVGAKVAPIRAQATTASKKEVILHKFTHDDAFIGPCLKNTKITGANAPMDTHHVIINTFGEFVYAEGQVIGVIPDGLLRQDLFSVASSARGDFGDSKTLSLCVERAGVTSNFLCDLKPGDDVKITGPMGKYDFFLPEDPNTPIIMLATRTGIAPCRSFWWKMFFEKHDDYKFNGLAWLFFGVPSRSTLLYEEEIEKLKKNNPDNFRRDYAVGEEQIQIVMAKYGDELWELIKNNNAYVYMCGETGMEQPIDDLMATLAAKQGIDWLVYKKQLKTEKRWNVRVY